MLGTEVVSVRLDTVAVEINRTHGLVDNACYMSHVWHQLKVKKKSKLA